MALTDSLVAYWKLDESSGNAADSSGNSKTLTNYGTTGFTTGLINSAADLGSSNSSKYFDRADNLGITGGNISISCWVKMNTEIGSGIGLFVGQGSATNYVGNYIAYDYNGGTRRLAFNRQKQFVANNAAYITGNLGTSSWHHLVFVYDGSNVTPYKNGTAGSTAASTGNGSGGTTNLTAIGRDSGGQYTTTYVSAIIDEVGIWSRALTAQEVTNLYNSGAGLAYPFTTGSAFIPKVIIF